MGPVASQIAIKQLGTNGGGFFNANSAHPVREPEPVDQLHRDALASCVISAGLTYTFGKMVGNTRQGWALFAAMSVLFFVGVIVATVGRAGRQPAPDRRRGRSGDRDRGPAAPGGNMEGKEVRFGIPLGRSGR